MQGREGEDNEEEKELKEGGGGIKALTLFLDPGLGLTLLCRCSSCGQWHGGISH